MKVGIVSLIGKFCVLALVPVLCGTGCNSNNQASASLPPSSPAAYPSNLQAAPTIDDSLFAAGASEEVPPAPKFKPFVLREGETLASYKVQKGDTLSKMAKMYGTSVGRIQSANGLDGSKILAGKYYKVPTRKTEAEIAALTEPRISTGSNLVSKPEPPTPPSSLGGTRTTIPAPPTSRTYTPGASRTFSPPPATNRPTFEPRSFDYSGPKISSPSRSESSITISTEDEEDSGGSGRAFPTPTFGSGTSF
jgi:LysM repeat protein